MSFAILAKKYARVEPVHTLTHGSALTAAATQLAAAGIDSARTDAELLLAHVKQQPLGQLRLDTALDRPLSAAHHSAFTRLIAERAARVPLQHLTGKAPFRQLELHVGPGVFIPRPETETLVDLALRELAQRDAEAPRRVLDLCAGSGAIGFSIAHELPDAHVTLVEKDGAAVAWTRKNQAAVLSNEAQGRTAVLHKDIRDLNAADVAPHSVDAVVTNPPYVPSGMVPKDAEVREHDPQLALYSGADGLDLIRDIAQLAQRFVAPGGSVLIEHAEHQGEAVREILSEAGWLNAATHADLTDRDRVTVAQAAQPPNL